VDRLSPIADGSLGSDSWRNTLNFQENTIRYLRFRAGLMNKPGGWLMGFHGTWPPARSSLLSDI
ncbi:MULTISPECIES: hypothetical protein, partial [unclassified Halomonas]|uniref:hypothetical protein n=1 Tax=unclassified Halomonas TaxID=2609666 RepID=UPI001EF6D869